MYLKHLTIKGFKSFAEKTEIKFEPGINIIVGPNGCGKSNIVDAIRWVLGETNVRNLRGLKQEDIIFSGTDKNSPLGLANVEIGIDNSDNALPIEFTELSLGRKLYRSGESEYNINKTRVRLKDINALFTGTGLGKQGFSIIGQGELEQVLTGHPFERRLILEEASGIIKYRQERDEVKKRLANTQEDLTRLNDLLMELKNQWEVLKTKEEKAQVYLKMREKLDYLQKRIMSFEINQLKCRLAEKQNQYENEKKLWAELNDQVNQRNFEILNLDDKRIKLHQNLMALQDEKHNYENCLRDIEAEEERQKERINNYKESIYENQLSRDKYTNLLSKLNSDLANNQENCAQEKKLLNQKELAAQQLQAELILIEAELNQDNAGLKSQIINLEKQKEHLVNLEHIIINLKAELAAKQERKNLLKVLNNETSSSLEDLNLKILEIEKELNSLGLKSKDISQKHNDIQKILQKKSLLEQKVITQINKNNQQIYSFNNRLNTLLELENNFSFYSEGVRNILKSARDKSVVLNGIKGTLGELIEVPPGLELAIETAAGRGLENIVVNHSSDAQTAIKYLKDKGLGRATFLPLDILHTQLIPEEIKEKIRREPGVLGLGNEIIHFDNSIKKAVDYLLGRLVIVERLSDGIKLFKKLNYPLRIVSREGDLLNASGAMSGGSNRPKSSLLKKRNEKISLKEQLIKAQSEGDKLERERQALRDVIDQLETEKENLEKQLSESAFKKSLFEANRKELCTKLGQLNNRQNTNLAEIQNISAELFDLEKQLTSCEAEYNSIQDQNLNFNEEMQQKKNKIEKLQREYEIKSERLQSQQEQIDMKRREISNMEEHLIQFCQVRDSYQSSLHEAEKNLLDLENHIIKPKELIAQLSIRKKEAENSLIRIIAEFKTTETAEAEVGQKLQTLKKEHLILQQKCEQINQRVRALEIQKIRLESEYGNWQQKWEEQFNTRFEKDLAAEMDKHQVKQYRRESAQLTHQLEMLGPVDVNSIKEFDEVNSRYDFMKQQYDDLITAKNSLEKLLAETEAIMNNCFEQFYKKANLSFQNTFRQIFAGGEASLSIEAPNDDSLAAGVEIMVKMPGKKIQNMNLLSGGERALTCIAFIFALLNLKAAPFCLLDEIDAALDENNLIRFTKYLQKMALKTQFIVVSHRQTTIAAGNKIYGITMAKQGISTVLSLDLSGVKDYLPVKKAAGNA